MKNVFEYPDLRSAADLDFEIKIALPLFETYKFSLEKNGGGKVTLRIKDVFDCILTAENCVFEPDFAEEAIVVDEGDCKVTGIDGRLCLLFHSELLDEKSFYKPTEVRLFFTGAKVQFRSNNVFDFPVSSAWDNPWSFLGGVCAALRRKALANGTLLNKAEREILPLACFIADCASPADTPKTAFSKDFVSLAKECGDEKAVELIRNHVFKADGLVLTAGIFDRLLKAEHEKLWRKIYELLLDSQRGVPFRRLEDSGLSQRLEESRTVIARILHEQGFSGEYPSFYKKTDIRFASFSSHNMLTTVINEKDASCFVRVLEFFSEDDVYFCALSGTRLSEKTGEEGDVFSCFFENKSKRRGVSTGYYLSYVTNELLSLPLSAEEFALIAAKRSELQKLSKTEAKRIEPKRTPFFLFLLMGIAFGLLFTAIYIPSMALFDSFETGVPFFQTLKDPLWKEISIYTAAGGGLLFSIGMALFEKIAKKR